MKNRKSQLLARIFITVATSYFIFFLGAAFFYLLASLQGVFLSGWDSIRTFVLWTTVGVSLSLLTTLVCWPFALSAAILIEHNKNRKYAPWVLKVLRYFSTLPLIIYVYIYIEVIGGTGFDFIKDQWSFLFASPNLLTQSIAFALTLILYPLSIFPFISSAPTVDLFYKNILSRVLEFAEVGLIASVVVTGLFVFLLPKMILYMRKQLVEEENMKSLSTIRSLGGTAWESIHLTAMQIMKVRFNIIVTYFTRICFFEGLITYNLLYYFVIGETSFNKHWGVSLSSIYVLNSMTPFENMSFMLSVGGFLVICYIGFMYTEKYFKQKEGQLYV